MCQVPSRAPRSLALIRETDRYRSGSSAGTAWWARTGDGAPEEGHTAHTAGERRGREKRKIRGHLAVLAGF